MIDWEKHYPNLRKYAKQQIAWGKLKFEAEDVVTYAYEKLRLKEFKSEDEGIKYCKGLIKNALFQERSEFRSENASLKIKEIKDTDIVEEKDDWELPDINPHRIMMQLDHYNRVLFQLSCVEGKTPKEICALLVIPQPYDTIKTQVTRLKAKVRDICKQLYNI